MTRIRIAPDTWCNFSIDLLKKLLLNQTNRFKRRFLFFFKIENSCHFKTERQKDKYGSILELHNVCGSGPDSGRGFLCGIKPLCKHMDVDAHLDVYSHLCLFIYHVFILPFSS